MKLLSLVFWCLIASTTSGEAKKRKHYTSSSYLDSYQFPDQPSNPNHYQQPNNNNNGGYGHGGGYLKAEEESPESHIQTLWIVTIMDPTAIK